MTIFRHEWKANRTSLCIWCGVVCAMTLLVMLMYPSFKAQMHMVSSLFAMMGPFSAAFGMDVLQIGTAIGFYGIESGAMLAIGGTMFAAFTGIAMLSKEEAGRTAEFLLTQPVGRARVVAQKLLALLALLLAFNAAATAMGWLCFVMTGEALPTGRFLLFHLMQLALHIEIGCICFAISALSRRVQVGLGLGLALLLYFLNLMLNMVDALDFLRYVTPFAYAEPSIVLGEGRLEAIPLVIGVCATICGVCIAFARYGRKDIAS